MEHVNKDYYFVIAAWREKRQNPAKLFLAPHEHRTAGHHVVARHSLPVRCSLALGQSDRQTKRSIMESALAARVVA
jgi:hypothetical protein